ncbi:hypothetical protein VTN96DRAFT_6794 [Rasamsonia emersonii]
MLTIMIMIMAIAMATIHGVLCMHVIEDYFCFFICMSLLFFVIVDDFFFNLPSLFYCLFFSYDCHCPSPSPSPSPCCLFPDLTERKERKKERKKEFPFFLPSDPILSLSLSLSYLFHILCAGCFLSHAVCLFVHLIHLRPLLFLSFLFFLSCRFPFLLPSFFLSRLFFYLIFLLLFSPSQHTVRKSSKKKEIKEEKNQFKASEERKEGRKEGEHIRCYLYCIALYCTTVLHCIVYCVVLYLLTRE